jgi:hypothetical protein
VEGVPKTFFRKCDFGTLLALSKKAVFATFRANFKKRDSVRFCCFFHALRGKKRQYSYPQERFDWPEIMIFPTSCPAVWCHYQSLHFQTCQSPVNVSASSYHTALVTFIVEACVPFCRTFRKFIYSGAPTSADISMLASWNPAMAPPSAPWRATAATPSGSGSMRWVPQKSWGMECQPMHPNFSEIYSHPGHFSGHSRCDSV